jgi:LemA protein
MPALIPVAIILGPLLWIVMQYNSLVGLRNYIAESWSNLDTELKRRYDLIPNLVETVKAYAAHERATLERVIELRNRCAANQGAVSHQAADEQQLVTLLRELWLVAENYPSLKADQHFLALQKELTNTENRIQAARRFYNGNIRDYANKCQAFPSNLVATVFNFHPPDYFDVAPAMREIPDVKF